MPSLVQVFPSRISITPQRSKKLFHDMDFNYQNPSYKTDHVKRAIQNFKAVKNPFIISKASKRKIMDSINSMYMLSKPRKIEMKTGKFIYNYKMSFITLTLPAKQFHSDTDIKSKALNQFLVELRKNYDVQNYVWKAELQKNENIHFHLLLDKYVDFQALRRRWNRCINKLGYVDAYQDKMSKLSFHQYRALTDPGKNQEVKTLSERYASGVRSNWSNPNSVDVRSVFGKKELASYLAKYITKSFDPNNNDSEDTARQMAFGRSWARSYSLSKLKYQNKYMLSEVLELIKYLKSEKELVKEIIGDFYTVFYFSADKLCDAFKKFHNAFIFGNAENYRYPLPHLT